MNMIAIRRQNIAFNISQNPATITIHRTEKVKDGGGFREVATTAGPFIVRIFQKREIIPKVSSETTGTKQTDTTFGLLADYLSDIRAGPNVKDGFSVDGLGSFVVKQVNQQIVQGQVVGFHVDLERVK